MKSNQRFKMILAVAALLAAFQNCAPNGGYQSTTFIDSERLGKVDATTHVTYDPKLEISASPSADALEIDLASSSLTVGGQKTCVIDADRIQDLREILDGAEVCEPAELAPNTATCLAIGLADIRLNIANSEPIQLRPVICHNGRFLCDGRDEKLRALLADLKANLPADCHGQ